MGPRDPASIAVWLMAGLFATWRFVDIDPYAGRRARLIFWVGPAISWFLVPVVARLPVGFAAGMTLMAAGVMVAIRMRKHWAHGR